MKTTRTITDPIATGLAEDVSFLAAASSNRVGLIVANFDPSIDLIFTDLTISVATGLTPINVTPGNQLESRDPVTGELIVTLRAPTGGWRWETPVGFVGPVTVYGFSLTDNSGVVLMATHKLANSIILTDPNQTIFAPDLGFRIDPSQIH